jgi:membrane-associated protease RseP (regulator of RpoE activity)
MKLRVESIKLAAAVGLLVASTALAAPDGKQPATSEPQDGPRAVVELPSGQRAVEWNNSTGAIVQPNDAPAADPDRRDGLIDDVFPSAISTPEYWIGVSCAPLPPVLREHLDIPDGQGIPVFVVVPGAPAAKAGILVNDILLTANKKPLHTIADVSQAVQEAQGKPVAFELIRKGQRQTVEVAPEKNPHWRPDEDRSGQPAFKSPPYDELDRIYQWFDRQFPGHALKPQMRLRFMHPGTILPPGAPMQPALPGTMSITIMKQGDQPTQITVTRDKETWKVDEKSIDKLPADVRPHVERMLQGMVIMPEASGPQLDYVPDWMAPRSPGAPPQVGPSIRERIEERMDRMNQQLQELQERMENLRQDKGPEETK